MTTPETLETRAKALRRARRYRLIGFRSFANWIEEGIAEADAYFASNRRA